MIYIDPPYNTGNDFIYPDNYSETLQTYLEYTGQVDGEGRKFSNNTETDGRFHSKWMNMMYPRLYLARNLLRDNGVIFISIDEHEVDNLRWLGDEIFGEENFVASIIWQKKYSTKADSKYFSESHEYLLVFAREITNLKIVGLERTEEQEGIYKNPDNDSRGVWTSDNLLRTEERDYAIYEIHGPNGQDYLPPKGSSWRFNKEKMVELIADNRLWFGEKGDGRPRLKRFRSEVRETIPPQTLWGFEQVGHTDEGTKELAALFDGTESPFPNPKPTRLIKRVVAISTGDDDLVLDFFAGSGTTGSAVFAHNRESALNRRFILVQLPEITEREDFKTIADITKERVRRVIQRNEKEAEGKLDLGNRPKEGFRVLKLVTSNFNVWNASTDTTTPDALAQQLELQIDHIQPGRSSEDLLYEILLKSGFPPTTPIETLTIEGKAVYSVTGYGMLICLEHGLTHELVRAIAERKPSHVVCLDEGFAGNDQLKTNAVLIMRSKGVTKFQTI